MPVPRVIENTGNAAPAYTRQHVWHHVPESRPRHDSRCINARKIEPHPIRQRLNAVRADISIEAVEFGGPSNTEAVFSQATGHDLRSFVEQANLRRCGLAFPCLKIHGDRIAFHRIDIDAIAY